MGLYDRDYLKKEDKINNDFNFEFVKPKNPYWKETPKKIYSYERPQKKIIKIIDKTPSYVKKPLFELTPLFFVIVFIYIPLIIMIIYETIKRI